MKTDIKKLFSYLSKILFYAFALFFGYYLIKNKSVFNAFKDINYIFLFLSFFIVMPAVFLLNGWQTYLIKKIYNVPLTFLHSFYMGVEVGASNYILPFGGSIFYRGGLLKVFHTLKMRDFFIYNFFYFFIVYVIVGVPAFYFTSPPVNYIFALIALLSLAAASAVFFYKHKLNFSITKNVFFDITAIAVILPVVFFIRYLFVIYAVTLEFNYTASFLLMAVVTVSLPLKITPAGFGVRELLMFYIGSESGLENIEAVMIVDRLVEVTAFFSAYFILKLKKGHYAKAAENA